MSNYSMGNAADKVLRGEVDPVKLDLIIARCDRCEKAKAYSWMTCWHLDARTLIDHGLRPSEFRSKNPQERLFQAI